MDQSCIWLKPAIIHATLHWPSEQFIQVNKREPQIAETCNHSESHGKSGIIMESYHEYCTFNLNWLLNYKQMNMRRELMVLGSSVMHHIGFKLGSNKSVTPECTNIFPPVHEPSVQAPNTWDATGTKSSSSQVPGNDLQLRSFITICNNAMFHQTSVKYVTVPWQLEKMMSIVNWVAGFIIKGIERTTCQRSGYHHRSWCRVSCKICGAQQRCEGLELILKVLS